MDEPFLRMIVQVTATLMGFAFLGPLIQAASSELFTGREKYIKSMVIYKRILLHKAFALFIFFCPFLSSFLLLKSRSSLMEQCITIVDIVFALGVLLWYEKGIKPTIARPKPVDDILKWLVRIAMILYICYATCVIAHIRYTGVAFFYCSFDSFIYITVLGFTVFGLLFLMDSLLTPIEKAILFKDSELEPEFEKSVEEWFQDAETALSNREERVQRLKKMHPPLGKKLEWHRDIAKYSSEAAFLYERLKGRKGLKKEWEKIKEELRKGEESECIHAHLSAFDETKEKVLAEYLPEFECVTKEIDLLLERFGVNSMNLINKPPCLFSVVIPTRGRCNFIEKLLVSLQRAITHSQAAVEIIVVDDSLLSERDIIESLCRQYGAQYLSGTHSVREKRNYGIEKSRGEIILFTDSDCEVTPNIFNEHQMVYAEADTAGVLGLTEFTGKESISWNIVSRTTFLDSFSFAKTFSKLLESAPWGTCTNLSFRKEVLEDVGKFDTTFPFRLGGDDTELGVRINEAGYKIKMNPNAVVFHTRETWSNLFEVAKKAFRWGRTDFHILKRHPHLGHIGFPNFLTVFLFLALICLTGILSGHRDVAVMGIIVWTASTLLLESTVKVSRAREKLHLIFFWLFARFLDLIFEAGAIFESLRRGSPSMLYKRIVYTPGQLVVEWESEVVRSWSIVIGLLLTLIVMWILRGV